VVVKNPRRPKKVAGRAANSPAKGRARNRATRDRVLQMIREAAIEEFSLYGLDGASTQAIADRAGLSKPQLHYYIAGKEELYEELLQTVFDDRTTALTLEGSDPRVQLTSYIQQKLNYSLDHGMLSRMFANEVISGGRFLSKFWPRARRNFEHNVKVIESWIESGLVRPLDPRLFLMNIWVMAQQYADYAVQIQSILQLGPDEQIDRGHVARELADLVLHGCLTGDLEPRAKNPRKKTAG
jgi:TetR/AcrR family transcriptional regulator